MPFDRAAARRDGYSDAQIDAFIRSDPTFAAEADATKRAASTPGFVHSVSRGRTYNFSDRLDALAAAGETAISNTFDGVGPLKRVPYSPGQAYDAVVRANQARAAQYAKEHPVADFAGTMLGGAYAPGSKQVAGMAMRGVGEATTLGQRALVGLRSGVGGGLMGAAYGAGGADLDQKLAGAAGGAFTGFAAGFATPTIVAGGERALKYAGRMGANAAEAAARAYPRAAAQANTAARGLPVVGRQIGRAIDGTARRAMTDPEIRAAAAMQAAVDRDAAAGVQLDPNVAPMFSQGASLQGAYDALAQSPGPSQTLIRRAAQEAADTGRDGMRADLGQHLSGTGDYWSKMDALIKTRRDNAKAGMDRIGQHLVTLSRNSIEALRSDLSKGALKEAAANGLASTDDTVRAGAANLNRLADAVFDKPSAQTITVREAQDISESLLSAADAAYRAGNNAKGKALKGLGKAIRENARDPNQGGFGEYDDFLKQYASDSEAQRAFELGSDAIKNGLGNSPEKVAKTLQGMGADAWDHYRRGLGEALYNKASEGGGLRVMRDLLRQDNFANRVRMAFRDPADFERFMTATEQRVHEANLSNRYIHGSPTFARQEAAKAMNDAGADPLGTMAEAIVNPAGLSAKAIKALIKQGGDKTLLTAIGNPRANAAMGTTANNAAELQALLQRLQDYRRLNAAPRLGGRAGLAGGTSVAARPSQ